MYSTKSNQDLKLIANQLQNFVTQTMNEREKVLMEIEQEICIGTDFAKVPVTINLKKMDIVMEFDKKIINANYQLLRIDALLMARQNKEFRIC